jgi:uncharacterized membrane protein
MDIFAQMAAPDSPAKDGGSHWVQMVGAFHPLVVHFPIALLLTAAALEVISIWKKDHSGLRFAIVINLTLGTLGAVVAAILGWMDAAQMGFEPDLKPVLAWHRWLGTSVAIGALITAVLWFRAAGTTSKGSLWIYRAALGLLAVILCFTGHLGALLVYGLDYFSS